MTISGLRNHGSSTSSGLLNADGVIKDKAGILVGYRVFTDGTNQATLVLYDNASAASGTVLDKLIVAGADLVGGIVDVAVEAQNGIYADITGTGASFIVHYI